MLHSCQRPWLRCVATKKIAADDEKIGAIVVFGEREASDETENTARRW